MTSEDNPSRPRSRESRAFARRLLGMRLFATVLGLAFMFSGPSLCFAQTLTLGQTVVSDDLGIFEGSGTLTSNGSLAIYAGNSFGNIGLGAGATFKNNGTAAYGTKYQGVSTSSLSTASTLANSLTVNGTFSNNTITGTGSVVVYDLSSITKSLTIDGNSTQTFIINVSQGITLNSSSITLEGGISADKVLFNVGGSITTNGSTTLNGTFLDVNNGITLNGSTSVHGSLVAGGAITSNGSTSVNASIFEGATVSTAPELPTSTMAGLALLLVVGKIGFDRLRRCRTMVSHHSQS